MQGKEVLGRCLWYLYSAVFVDKVIYVGFDADHNSLRKVQKAVIHMDPVFAMTSKDMRLFASVRVTTLSLSIPSLALYSHWP